MRRELLIIREPGEQIPEEFKTKALAEHPTALGYASPQEGSRIDWGLFTGDEDDLVAAINQLETAYKDDRIFYHLTGADEGEINYESLQPFELMSSGKDDEKTTLMVAMTEGIFEKYDDAEDKENTNDLRLVQQYLQPKIDALADVLDSDIERMLSNLAKDRTKIEMTDHLAPRGTVILIPCKGQAISFAENTLQGQWKWGFATKTLGFMPETKVEAPATEDKPLTMKEKAALRAKAIQGTATPAKEVEEKKPKTPEEEFAPVLKDPRFYISNGRLRVKLPRTQSFKEGKTFWNSHCKLDTPKKSDGTVDAAVLYQGWDFEKDTQPNSFLWGTKSKLMGDPKPKEAEHEQGPAVPTEPVPTEKKPEVEMTMHIPAKQKERYLELMKAGVFSKPVSLEKLKADSEATPAPSLQLGEKGFETFLYMSRNAKLKLGSEVGTHTVLCLLEEACCRLLGLYGQKPAQEAVATGTNPNVDKPALTMKEKAALRAKAA